jgi:hypothetical protein
LFFLELKSDYYKEPEEPGRYNHSLESEGSILGGGKEIYFHQSPSKSTLQTAQPPVMDTEALPGRKAAGTWG